METSASPCLREICPACGDQAGVPLIFGFPNPKAIDAAAKLREVVLGGYNVLVTREGHKLNMACLNCAHEWYDPEAKAK